MLLPLASVICQLTSPTWSPMAGGLVSMTTGLGGRVRLGTCSGLPARSVMPWASSTLRRASVSKTSWFESSLLP